MKFFPATRTKSALLGYGTQLDDVDLAALDWPATTIVARLTGHAAMILKESVTPAPPNFNPRHGPGEVANSYWISMHHAVTGTPPRASPLSRTQTSAAGIVAAHGVRLNTLPRYRHAWAEGGRPRR